MNRIASADRPAGRRHTATRDVVVTAREYVTERMLRVTFAGDDLHAVVHGTPASWVKLFVPVPGGGEHGRAYTIRGFNPLTDEVDIDVFIHPGGAVPRWAEGCRVGERVRIAGPRRSGAPGGAGPLLLFGDETSLPAILAIAGRAPGNREVRAFVELGSESDRQDAPRARAAVFDWLVRSSGDAPGSLLLQSAGAVEFAPGSGVWFAAEARAAQRFRRLLAGRDAAEAHVQGYWRAGVGDYRE